MARKTSKTAEITFPRIVWSNIRKQQYLNGLSNNDLAMIFDCSTKTISNYENDPSHLTVQTINAFCEALHIEPMTLVVK
jgi:transcriptional regulator with XRE-family HTH domain